MSLGYLLASLPYLDYGREPGVTVEGFCAACAATLSPGDAAAAALLARGDTEPSDHPAVRRWRDLEAAIDAAVGRRRLARRGSGGQDGLFVPPASAACPVWLTRLVDAAFESAQDPLAREEALDRVRWAAADELGGFDPMAKGQVFAYAVRLRLAARRMALDAVRGRERLEAALPRQTL